MTVGLSDAQWFKSSHSASHSDCVEVAFLGLSSIGVRDSKNPSGPALIFTSAQWDTFISGIANGRFSS